MESVEYSTVSIPVHALNPIGTETHPAAYHPARWSSSVSTGSMVSTILCIVHRAFLFVLVQYAMMYALRKHGGSTYAQKETNTHIYIYHTLIHDNNAFIILTYL